MPDVRYNGYVVGEVSGVTSTDDGQMRLVHIDLDPKQGDRIPGNVTARTVPSNLFGVNSVEPSIPPVEGYADEDGVWNQHQCRHHSADYGAADARRTTIADILRAVPPSSCWRCWPRSPTRRAAVVPTFAMFSGVAARIAGAAECAVPGWCTSRF